MAPNDLIQQQPQPPQQQQQLQQHLSNEVLAPTSVQQAGPSLQANNTTTTIIQA